MKKYLISGIGPGPTGVGRLVSNLVINSKLNGYSNVFVFANKSVRKLLNEKKYLDLSMELLQRIISKIAFKLKLIQIKDSEIILIYPQGIGIKNFKKLVNHNTIVKWYVMDNSFFCMKSYNYLNGECLRCLDSLKNIDSHCYPKPYPYNKDEYMSFLEFLKLNIQKIKLYAQSDSHKELLQEFYGKDIDVTVVGMDTGEFKFNNIDNNPICQKNNTIVFHNHLVDAKGFSFAYEIAKNMPQYHFIFPAKKPTEINEVPSHIKFLDISWDNGLKEIVEKARLVLCLSMWSSPIEGALVKSIYYNGNVAVMDNRFGFNTEIPQNVILKLDYNLALAISKIDYFMKNESSELSSLSRYWLQNTYLKYDISKLFLDK
jgi:hypothetical protein